MNTSLSRKEFLTALAALAAGAAAQVPLNTFGMQRKLRVVLVGTGVRGISFWGRRLVEQYPDLLEFVGLSDINPGRLAYAKRYMGVNCPTFVDFDELLRKVKPDLVIVCTKDSTHHEFIIKGLAAGCDVLTEKPLTTDEAKAQAILDAERKYDKNLIVGFNYRWSPYMTKIKELLQNGEIGDVTSVDFNWYLNVHHGASYFRRWHGLMDSGGSLWVHKATHHFDLLNWWLDSEPEEVFAYGALEHYGSNGPFRGKSCRSCPHKQECAYYWDITKDRHSMNLYVENEAHDGYVRDGCVYRHEIDIYDKMSAQIKYANNVVANYSLTTYSPFEGWRIAFNGHKGRIEAWLDIPWMKNGELDQESLHAAEMDQTRDDVIHEPLVLYKNWTDYKIIQVASERGGHGGGDRRLHDKLFRDKDAPDPYGHTAGVRDGAMSILVGVAARRSIEQGAPVKIASLTDLKPMPKRMA
ncbi:Oxidoreductase family, C-terminal alpha/beta domain [Parapedobacter composti]|uniref:Oxidoreductase family, C-terminal alpha/beta domain n=1 Tax=Parapedobacter composti TaxID=623281 RepID=A0A1I1I3Y7_9SPHI|nr:Gfo/Idh/MocA family oxidoreductase [Parapedobacter composti]SFC27930.1 Oxidoreductase family, C-terminal alpha/beta domain [Parapedobacter composti]